MLYTQTVEAGTYELLKSLMADQTFRHFALAGGTALSLLIGHRKSIDLDLFTTGEFNSPQLEKYLQGKYAFKGDLLSGSGLKGEVNGIKLDIIRHDYPDVEPRTQEDGIRLYSLKDIAAMKLSAIADNGTRLKDFIDVAYLSGYLSLKEMLAAFKTKYPQTNPYRAVKGLNYYDDIRFSERIDLLGKGFNWETIATRLSEMTREENRHFQPLDETGEKRHVLILKKRGRGI